MTEKARLKSLNCQLAVPFCRVVSNMYHDSLTIFEKKFFEAFLIMRAWFFLNITARITNSKIKLILTDSRMLSNFNFLNRCLMIDKAQYFQKG